MHYLLQAWQSWFGLVREGQAVRAVRDDTPTKAKLRPSSEAAEGEDAVLSWTEDEAAGGRRCTESMEEELKISREVEWTQMHQHNR